MMRVCHSVEQTEALARELAAQLRPGDWVGLIGPLGAGKSVFARAIGRAWGVRGTMPSPTYTLMATHVGRCPIHHIDLYRIGSMDELDFAGLEPYFSGTGICLVEWADRARALWPPTGWAVTISLVNSGERRIVIEPFGQVGGT
ncbi:MAG: tRNA (adenosine(37)-N6)-threonylcarbamoyltransferase complex ATPase subunit type 1 TsaE [Candidatus Zixiibacteriota bacterium]